MTDTINDDDDERVRCVDNIAPVVEEFIKKGWEREYVVRDMIRCLMHYARKNGQDPEEEMDHAIDNFINDFHLAGEKVEIQSPWTNGMELPDQ